MSTNRVRPLSTHQLEPHIELNLSPSDLARYWARVDKNGPTIKPELGPCWLWTGSKEKGYGHLKVGKVQVKTHRIAFFIAGGKTTTEKPLVLHKCDTPNCVNPEHLFAGNHFDNAQDRKSRGRTFRAFGNRHWTKKHPDRIARGEIVMGSKLTPDKVRAIRQRSGEATGSLAAAFAVSTRTIQKIVKRQTWGHVE